MKIKARGVQLLTAYNNFSGIYSNVCNHSKKTAKKVWPSKQVVKKSHDKKWLQCMILLHY